MKRLLLILGIVSVVSLLLWSVVSQSSRPLMVRQVSEHVAAVVDSTNWYISNSGIDAWDGHSIDRPLRTIAVLNTKALRAGDSVFFNMGDSFAGQLNVTVSGRAEAPIVFTSYGTGAKPIISGALSTFAWVPRGAFYAAKANGVVKSLLCDGAPMSPARWPNLNDVPSFVRITSVAGTKTLHSTQLTQTTNYWQGCNIRLRETGGYRYATLTVHSSSGDHVVYSGTPSYTPAVGYSFTLDGCLAALDTPGEWYYGSNDTLYLWTPNGSSPALHTVEASIYEYGLKDSSYDYITVNGLEFRGAIEAGIVCKSTATNIRITNCVIRGIRNDGITMGSGSNNAYISGNLIQDVFGNAIAFHSGTGDTITGNTLKRIGIWKGLGSEPVGSGLPAHGGGGIGHDGDAVATFNTLDSIGGTGINALRCSFNYINHCVMTETDAGAVYVYQATGANWHHNIVENVIGDTLGANALATGAVAYYLDGPMGGSSSVKYNSAFNIQSCGVFIQYGQSYDTVSHNTFYNCGADGSDEQMKVVVDTLYPASAPIRHPAHVCTHNTVISFSQTSAVITIRNQNGSCTEIPGTFDYNTYAYDLGGRELGLLYHNGIHRYELAAWRTATSQEAHSLGVVYSVPTYFINPTASDSTVTLTGSYKNLQGTTISGSMVLAPYMSKVLLTSATPYGRESVTSYDNPMGKGNR